jgi:hypothetical protein
MDREPFIQNMWILWNTRRDLIQPHTVFVPDELEIVKDPATTEIEVRYTCTPANGFYPNDLNDDVGAFDRAGLGNLYKYLIPDRIML